MRLLALALVVVLTFPVTPASSPSRDDRGTLQWALDQMNELRGSTLGVHEFQHLASVTLALPADAIGIRVFVDWSRGGLVLTALHDFPIEEAKSGCVLPQGGAGWLVAPVGAGDESIGCSYQSHEGRIRHSSLVCALGTRCALDLGQLQPFPSRMWLVECDYEVAVLVHWSWGSFSGTSEPYTARCDLDFFGGLGRPSQWEEHDSLLLGTPGSAVAGYNNVGYH